MSVLEIKAGADVIASSFVWGLRVQVGAQYPKTARLVTLVIFTTKGDNSLLQRAVITFQSL